MKITAESLNEEIGIDGTLILHDADGSHWAPSKKSTLGGAKLTMSRAALIARLGIAVRMRDGLDVAITNMETLINSEQPWGEAYNPYEPTHVHKPTGNPCSIMQKEGGRAYCNFGGTTNPFSWVELADLLRIEQPQPLGTRLSNPHEQNP